jgi:integrase
VLRQLRFCAKYIASEQSLNIAKALHREFFNLPELRLQTISRTSQQLFVDFVEPSLSLLKFCEQRWRLTTIGDHTRKMPPKSGVTLETFVKEWRTNVAVNLKRSTTRAAESHLRAHILPKLGSLTLTEINTKIVQSFVAYLATGGRSRKTVENVLLTLSSILRKARAWDYACGSFSLADITLPREGVKKEQRCFSDEEIGKILAAAPEPFGTIFAVISVLGLRIGEALALRVSDVDFTTKIVRVRQSVDSATRQIQAVKSNASSADVPLPFQLEARLRKHLQTHDGKSDLLFIQQPWPPISQQTPGKGSAPAA